MQRALGITETLLITHPQLNVYHVAMIALLKFTHLFIVLFLVFAWLVPFPIFWIAQPILMLLVFWHWQQNQGECVLTKWERRLSSNPLLNPFNEQAAIVDQGEFSRRLLKKIGLNFSNQSLKKIVYGLPLTSAALCVIRLVFL